MTEGLFDAVAACVRASVVQVHPNGRPGAGAGIAWRPGLIVTSAHVANAGRVTIVTSSGDQAGGRVVRSDPRRDLAIVHAPDAQVKAATSIDPRRVRSGSLILAIGHPLGVKDAVSVGILQTVGAFPGEVAPGMPRGLDWVQADIRLAPGNSGGPMADAEGRVIGVSAMVVAGLALAVPSTDVETQIALAEASVRARAAARTFR